ncbi:Cthe_2314 family HEPN domain-containing protein [Ferviditalea candida]|uniref:Cthe_2314 family HEPN domain-containing protein n=1 Tax=Ferviditalea candida TaxID=3108399 RepID=A0ABU5ZDA7_9BACL|nr:Cthe_2314 family HEPN domain-containing protein [Paenibacillaceae bacterium T2]
MHNQSIEDFGGLADKRLEETIDSVKEYCSRLRKRHQRDTEIPRKMIHLEMWARGFVDALLELDYSLRNSARFREGIDQDYQEALTPEQQNRYHLHAYYYKNAFIRIFSILDKLGYFLTQLFDLEKYRTRAHYSYFTVLSWMHSSSTHPALEQELFDLKVKYRKPLDRLHKMRNLEIHSINVEMLDDLHRDLRSFAERNLIEPLDENLHDLREGYEMVQLSLKTVFDYCADLIGTDRNR